MEEERDSPWNFHTCKSCTYRSKSAFIMCNHVRLHRSRPKTDTFLCHSKAPEMLECEFCEFYTDLKVNMCEHFRVFHEEKEFNPEWKNILKCFSCQMCHFKTHSLLVLTKHVDDCVPPSRGIDNNFDSPRKRKRKIAPRKRMKRHCCYFCSKLVTTIGRHLQYTHRKEPEIKRILLLPSCDRRRELKKLRLRGDKAYNATVEPNKRIPVRKLVLQEISQSIECPRCFGLISRQMFFRHKQRCYGTSGIVFEGNEFPESLPRIKKKTKQKKTIKEKYSKNPEEGKCKRHFCCFCHKLVTTMGRHLLCRHKDEPEVIRILKLHSSDRIKEVRKLRLRGDKIYNEKVEPNKRIPVRIPVFQNIHAECSNCGALISKDSFSRHERKCIGRPTRKRRPRAENETELDKLLGGMEDDEIGRIVENDETIKLLGVHFIEKSDNKISKVNTARTQLRKCARLLLIVKNLDPSVKQLKDCFTAEKYSFLMEAIKSISKFDGITFKSSATAMAFGPLLSRICTLLKAEYLKNIPLSDPQIVTLDGFMNLHKTQFSIDISGRIRSEVKRKKTLELLKSEES